MLQIGDQRRDRLIDEARQKGNLRIEVQVVIPRPREDVDEADALLDHAPRQQTMTRKGGVSAWSRCVLRAHGRVEIGAIDAVLLERRRALARKVDERRHFRLHTVRQLVVGDARRDLWISHLRALELVEARQAIERTPLGLAIEPGRCVDVEDRIASWPKHDPRVGGRQEATAPQRFAAGERTARVHDHVARQIIVGAAQAIVQPRAHRRVPLQVVARLHHELTGVMVELRRVQRVDEADFVGVPCQIGQQVRQHHAALPVGRERSARIGSQQHGRVLLNERETFAV